MQTTITTTTTKNTYIIFTFERYVMFCAKI